MSVEKAMNTSSSSTNKGGAGSPERGGAKGGSGGLGGEAYDLSFLSQYGVKDKVS
jgi:hypothetical protein